jgi:cell division protein FtsA
VFSKNILFLDVGSGALKGIVINAKTFKILTKATQHDSGIKHGRVYDAEKFDCAIKMLIKKLEKNIRSGISNTVLILGSSLIKYKGLVSDNIKIDRIVTDKTMRLIQRNIEKWIEINKVVLINTTNIEYRLDDAQISNPIGLYGETLRFQHFLAYAHMNQLCSLLALLEKNNLDIIDIYPSIYCAAALHLNDDERILGGVIFDIGSQSINWAHYYDNKSINAGAMNFGSESLTYSIAKSLQITIGEAEKLKQDYASAILTPQSFCQWAEFNKNGNLEYILASEISRKILPDVEHMISHMHKIISNIKIKPSVVVLCGYGARLLNLSQLAQRNLSITVKTIASVEPEFDALHGAIVMYQQQKKEIQIKKRGIIKKFANWLSEIF